MMTDQRKAKIARLAESLAQGYHTGNVTDLGSIVSSEEIILCHDDYGDAFDGVLFLDDGQYYIHVNSKLNWPGSKRERFTVAHEIGHYCIDEHRLGLKYGALHPHSSRTSRIGKRDLIEEEADYFAACLLMPEVKFKTHAAKKKRFSLDSILDLSQAFQSSIVSAVLRFADVGTHEMMAVFAQENVVKWYAQSKDFPPWPFKFNVHGLLPPTTVAGEFYRKAEAKYTGVEKVSVDDWFYPFANDSRAERKMYEQCYYSESYGYTISLIWFD